MEQMANAGSSVPIPGVRRVPRNSAFRWLAGGWSDLWRVPSLSLPYGVLAALVGAILLWLFRDQTYLAPALSSGFLLLAPVLAINLYALSRRLERGEPVDSVHVLDDWRHNRAAISLFGLVLALTLLAWERISAVLFALFYGGDVPELTRFLEDVLFSGRYLDFVVAYFAAGAVLAVVVFCISVVSLPLMLDRDMDTVAAILTSLRAVRANPGAMLVWAALIALLMALGYATLMIGVVVIFPLLAHATWHCYRDVVD
ncbi:MAG TPA: DUF2189 domain-containing protein [Burkholderiales bacterium]|nr:DUF2189 domain-containing protein [Burkholderiales bacterium]